jgi:hypothetical protein
MGLTDRDQLRLEAQRKVLAGGCPVKLSREIGDVACIHPHLAMVASLFAGGRSIPDLAKFVGIDLAELERVLASDSGGRGDAAIMTQFQMQMESKAGVRFFMPPYHDRLGVALRWGWADDAAAISAGSWLVRWSQERLAQVAGVALADLSAALRKRNFSPRHRNDFIQALRSAGCKFMRGESGAWLGVSLPYAAKISK